MLPGADIATVLEGQLVASSVTRLPFGMHSVSQHLQKLLTSSAAAQLSEAALDVFRNAIIRVAESDEDFNSQAGKVQPSAAQPEGLDSSNIKFRDSA